MCWLRVGGGPLATAVLGWLLWCSVSGASGAAEGASAEGDAKSSPAALAMYADAANYQNRQAFELAAEEWSRFLERFGADPLASKAEHYLGVCRMQLKQYAAAATAFQAVIEKHPKFELIQDACLNLGWCQYCQAEAGDKELFKQAAATFDKLAKDFPQGTFADQALFYQGEALYALGERKDAAMAYGRLATGHPKSRFHPDALYALGVTLEEMGEWSKARQAYEMFVEGYPKHELLTEVRMRVAESILQEGDAAQAESLFAEVAAVDGFDSADHALFRQAHCAARQEKLAEAAALYAAVATRFPKSAHVPDALLSAGRCYYRAGEYGKAAGLFEQAIAAGGDQVAEAGHWLARIHLRNRAYDQALKLVDETLAKAANHAFATNLKLDRADALYEMEGRRADALQEYLAVFKADPRHELAPQALYYAAFAAFDLQKFAEAEQLANQFLQNFPQDPLVPDARYVVAECLLIKKEYASAEPIYRQLIEQHSDRAECELWRVRLGLAVYLQQNYEGAIALLEPLLAESQSSDTKAEVQFLIGVCRFRLKQFADAVKSLQGSVSASATWRQADETLLYLARSQRELSQWEDAEGTLLKLQQSFPQSQLLAESHYFLGELRFAAGKYAEAVAAYDRVVLGWPQSSFTPFSVYGRGWALLKQGLFEEAAKSLSSLIALEPPHRLRNDALLTRGMCYRQLKQHAEAIADIEQFLASNPEPARRADACYERGLAEVSAQQYDRAVKTFSSLLAEHAQYPAADKVLYELAWAQKSLGDQSGAVASFAALAEKHPNSPLAAEANFHRAEDRYAAKEYAQAVEVYGLALSSASDAGLQQKILHKLGWTYYQMAQYPQAMEQFDRQLKVSAEGPLAADASFMRGECLFKSGEHEKALAAFLGTDRAGLSSPQMAVLLQLHAGQAAGQLGKWDQSLELLDAFVQSHPDSNFLAEAYFERGQAKQKLGKLDDAALDFQQAAERSRGAVGARAQFMIGEIRFQQKDFAQAIKDFQRVMFRAVPEGAEAELHNWQAKAGYEAGRCCEVQVQAAQAPSEKARLVAEATKFYRYVVEEHAENELAAQAKKRLLDLAKL